MSADRMKGGEEHRLHRNKGEVYSKTPDGKGRDTVLDYRNSVRAILSPKLPLTPEQRAVGNYFGHCVELATGCRSGDLTMERVDGGANASSDVALFKMMSLNAARVAEEALSMAPLVTFSARGAKSGPHNGMTRLALVSAVCVGGSSLTDIGLHYGWWTDREVKRGKKSARIERIVPDRQRKTLSTALVNGLIIVELAWRDAGITYPSTFLSVEVL